VKISKMTVYLSGALLVWGAMASGQSSLELKPVLTVPVPNLSVNGILEPIKCDSDSNIYVEAWRESDSGGRSPVVKLSPDGKRAITFPLPQLDDKKLRVLDFAPSGDGGVVLLTTDEKAEHYYVESYSATGQFDSRFTLPDGVEAMQIAASSQGKILVGGQRFSPTAEGAERVGKPYAGEFRSDGRLEREVFFAEGGQGNEGKTGAPSPQSPQAEHDRWQSLWFSSMQFSPRGDFVLARLGSGGSISIISAYGFETNRIHLSPPPESRLSSVSVAGNSIVALFIAKKTGHHAE
jgi:hypothetical protein